MHAMPDQFDLSELARAMQYLPHVKQLTFEHLHAPEEELKEYMRGLKRSLVLRPLVARLRKRLQDKRLRQRGIEPNADDNCSSQSPLHLKRRDTSLYDWGGSKLIQREHHEPVVGSGQGELRPDFDLDRTQGSPTSPHDRAIESAKLHSFAGWFTFACTLDASGLKGRLWDLEKRSLHGWKPTSFFQRSFALGLVLAFVVAFLARNLSTWRILFE